MGTAAREEVGKRAEKRGGAFTSSRHCERRPMRALTVATLAVACAEVVTAGSIRGAEPAEGIFCTPTVERDFTCAWSWMKRLQSEVPTTVCNVAKMLEDVNSKRAELHEDVDQFLGQFADGASGRPLWL